MAKKKTESNTPMMILIAVVALGVGFFIGRTNMAQPEKVTADDTEEAAVPTAGAPAQPNILSPEKLAKEKNVPATMASPQGDFTLVAVVEGEEANKSLHRSLQVVSVQRQRLTQLSRQYDQTAPALAQQREMIAGKINETRKSLEQNLKFMAQNYAYVLSNNYLLAPHLATLNLLEGTGKDQKKTLVYTFKDAASYEAFQKKTDAYSNLKREQKQAHLKSQEAAANPPAQPSKANEPLPLTPVMLAIQAEMKKIYGCDPEKTYLVDFQKTALYARKAR